MKASRPLTLCIFLMCIVLDVQSQKKEIIGYYPSWQWRSRNNLVRPSKIPYQKLTVINYAFFYPLPDGTLVGRDSVGDDLILNGELVGQTGERKPGTALIALAHHHGVKVMLSIGGWEDSKNFPEAASTQEHRIQFAHSCVNQIQHYGFDGIDIDWEYPGYVDHKEVPADRENFTLLLKVLRDSLTAAGISSGKKLLLTAALPAGVANLKGYDIAAVVPLLDYLNLMTYDFNGSWSPTSGHNAPLYSSQPDNSSGNIDATFNLFTQVFNVSALKINIGVPFYGHTFSNCTALHAPHSGADTIHFSPDGVFYHRVLQRMGDFTRRWDDRAKVPYLVNEQWKVLVSYDDEESVGWKARYVLEKNAAGVIIWEITGDYLPDGRTPLLDVINTQFNGVLRK